jgi:hypothetical protein
MHRLTIYFTRHSKRLRDACQDGPGAASGCDVGGVSDLLTYLADESLMVCHGAGWEGALPAAGDGWAVRGRWLEAALSKGDAPESALAGMHPAP